MKNRTHLVLLIIIFAVAFFLRFYKLGDIPRGLYSDETAIGYNAYSLIQTGKDEYGKSFPLYFKSFGDWKLPVYIYSDIIPIQLFGLNAFAVRFPSALFGFLTIIIFYFFISDLTKNKKLSLISTSLLAINPWALHYNRATFEVSICLFFFILGGFLLNKFFQKHLTGTFFIGTICFIIALYAYNLTRILSPLLFVLFIYHNRKYLKKSSRKEIIVTVIFAFLTLIPFIMSLIGNGGVSSAKGTLIYSSAAVQAPLHELRTYVNVLPFHLSSIFFNKYLLTIWQYIQNIFSYFSVSFFFITGSSHGNHGIGDVGLFYLFEFPLVILGIISMIKRKIPGFFLLLIWSIIVILIAALTRDVPHATRSFFLVMPFEVMSGVGLLAVYQWIDNRKSMFIKSSLFTIGGLVILFNLVFYFASYYVRFPILYAKAWRLEDQSLSYYLRDHEKKYDKIIFDDDAGFIYSSLLFYYPYSPSEFQRTVKRTADDSEGFSNVISFGKYEFRDINWDKDIHLHNTLIITSKEKLPLGIPTLTTFLYPKRTVAFAVKQDMYQYPVEDVAYVVVETK